MSRKQYSDYRDADSFPLNLQRVDRRFDALSRYEGTGPSSCDLDVNDIVRFATGHLVVITDVTAFFNGEYMRWGGVEVGNARLERDYTEDEILDALSGMQQILEETA